MAKYGIYSTGKYISFFNGEMIATISGKNSLKSVVNGNGVDYSICGRTFRYNWTKPEFTINNIHPDDIDTFQDLNNVLLKSLMDFINFYVQGGGGGGSWGSITGDIDNQLDLIAALDEKANTDDLATVATSGSYDDLSDKPNLLTYWGNIVGTLADQTDLNTALAAKANTDDLQTVATTGAYDDLSGTPEILSQWGDESATNLANALMVKAIKTQVEQISGGTVSNRGSVYNAFTSTDDTYKVESFTVTEAGTGYQAGDAVFIPTGEIDAIFTFDGTTWSLSKKGDSDQDFGGVVLPKGGSGTGLEFNVVTEYSNASTLADIVDPVNGNIAYVIKDEIHSNETSVYGFMDYNGDGTSNWVQIAQWGGGGGGTGGRDFTVNPILASELGTNAVTTDKIRNENVTWQKLAPDVTSNINANLQGVAYLNVAQNWTATQNYKANIGLDVATNISSDGVPLFSIRPEETGERTFIVKTPTDHYGFRLNNIGAAISANDAVTLSQLNNVVNYGTNTYLTKSPQLQQIVVVQSMPSTPEPNTLYVII